MWNDKGHLQVLGRIEIAELLDVDQRTPHAWYQRDLLPPPDHGSVNGSPAWNRDTIVRWAVITGRLPDSLAIEGAKYGPQAETRGGRKAKKAVREESTRD